MGLNYLFFSRIPKPDTTPLAAAHANFAITCILIVLALLALATLVRWKRHAKVRPSTLAWGAVFIAVLVGLHQLCVLKMVHTEAAIYGACCTMAVVGGIACMLRDVLFDRLDAADKKGLGRMASAARAIRDCLCLLGAAMMCMFATEMPWNVTPLPREPFYVWVEFVMILVVLTLLYFAAMRRGIGPALGVVAGLALGEAQYFVTQFRGSPMMPADMLAVQTAAAVSGGYSFELRETAMMAIAWAIGALCLMVFVQPKRLKGTRRLWRVGGCVACALACALACAHVVHNIDFKKEFGFTLKYYQPYLLYKSYCDNGLLPTFVTAYQNMHIRAPQGYSEAQARQDQAELAAQGSQILAADAGYAQAKAQFDAEQPSIIVVMNETFSDLSIFDGLHVGYTGPDFFKNRFAGTLAKGPLEVSVHGGGTPNSELEFLASTTMASVGYGIHPYAIYRLDRVPTLLDTFAELGYATTAIHPAEPTNWHRDLVYPGLGFDEFLDEKAFKGAPQIRFFTTDAATYDKALEVLQEGDGPQLIFDVTIQNHGGYTPGGVPEEGRTDYHLAEADLAEHEGELNEFLTLINYSDADLEQFIAQLSALDKKVVLIFYGDHQPSMTTTFNSSIFANEDKDSLAHGQRIFESVYAVWTNYPVAGRESGFAGELRASTSSLASVAMQAVGGPFDEAALARLALQQDVPAANVFGYLGADGNWYAWDDAASPYAEQAHKLQELEYLNFGSHVY